MASLEQEIQQTHFASEHIKATINVLFTANWLQNKISAKLKPFNLTHEQFNVLRILRGSHPKSMCQKDILSRMIAPNSNVTLIINKLIDKSLVNVEMSEKDKRAYNINITKEGLTLLKSLDKELNSLSDVATTLSISEAFHLNALLDKLRTEL
jgi:hypothetical protein